MKRLMSATALLFFLASVQCAEKPTIINETDKNQKIIFYNARFYEKDRPIKTEVTLTSKQSMVIPWEKAYKAGGPLIYDIQKIALISGTHVASELPITQVNRALLSSGIVYVAIEAQAPSGAKLVVSLTQQGKEHYLELSDEGKKRFRDLDIRINLSAEQIKKYTKKEVQCATQLPNPLAGIISEYAISQKK